MIQLTKTNKIISKSQSVVADKTNLHIFIHLMHFLLWLHIYVCIVYVLNGISAVLTSARFFFNFQVFHINLFIRMEDIIF